MKIVKISCLSFLLIAGSLYSMLPEVMEPSQKYNVQEEQPLLDNNNTNKIKSFFTRIFGCFCTSFHMYQTDVCPDYLLQQREPKERKLVKYTRL